jgi:broad specificity phosphatase PhoE
VGVARVILIRHGETDWSRDGRWQGWSDVPLNERGLRQARELVEPLARQHPTHLAVSDLTRARQTLQPLADALGLEPAVDPDLREIDVGTWAGLSHAEAAERFPDGVAGTMARPTATSPPAASAHCGAIATGCPPPRCSWSSRTAA